MRRSQLHAPTIRENPTEAETVSHRLLLRAGFIRPLSSGIYSMLPMGLRVKRKLENIIREELNNIGALEFDLPSLQPAEVWKESGRWNAIGTEMLRLRDRSGREMCLGMTHEEIFTGLAKELRSYRELPTIWYQIARKFRDEPRPRGGMIRLREFTMKDSYSFAIDEAGLDAQFEAHEAAYRRIFERCGLTFVVASADNGSMGGSASKEFVALCEAGEDWVAISSGDYAANLEVATSVLEVVNDSDASTTIEEFATPDVHTIDDLEKFGVPATRQMKTLVMMAQGEPIVIMLRGDHQLNETKLARVLGTDDLRPAEDHEALKIMGANFGSLGPIGVKARIIVDKALEGRRGMVSGANKDGFHVRGLEPGRDFSARFADVRSVKAGELAPDGSGMLEVRRGLELGHIFKLGTRYAAALGATVQTPEGKSTPLVMGSYGIGIERLMAAVAETHHDEKGLKWLPNLAPFEIMLLELGSTNGAATKVYEDLKLAGFDVLFDDRDERAGVKFSEAELYGIPFCVVAGAKGLERGILEVRNRISGEISEVKLEDLKRVLMNWKKENVDGGRATTRIAPTNSVEKTSDTRIQS
jgi:prolyl-tRNA synthetase